MPDDASAYADLPYTAYRIDPFYSDLLFALKNEARTIIKKTTKSKYSKDKQG